MVLRRLLYINAFFKGLNLTIGSFFFCIKLLHGMRGGASTPEWYSKE